jgi:hypothetical protein
MLCYFYVTQPVKRILVQGEALDIYRKRENEEKRGGVFHRRGCDAPSNTTLYQMSCGLPNNSILLLL